MLVIPTVDADAELVRSEVAKLLVKSSIPLVSDVPESVVGALALETSLLAEVTVVVDVTAVIPDVAFVRTVVLAEDKLVTTEMKVGAALVLELAVEIGVVCTSPVFEAIEGDVALILGRALVMLVSVDDSVV